MHGAKVKSLNKYIFKLQEMYHINSKINSQIDKFLPNTSVYNEA